MNNIALIHKDPLSRLYFGEIRNEEGHISAATLKKSYSELSEWAREHNVRMLNLDVKEWLEQMLE